MPEIKIINNDCLIALREYPGNHFDSVVSDPPYGISFMGKSWDYQIPSVELWKEVFRVLKPGGHILIACGTRTQHRMAVNIEDAGFEIRDIVSWIYGSGFPKALDVSKAIDQHFNKERKVVGKRKHPTLKDSSKTEEQANAAHGGNAWNREWNITEASTEEAKIWNGWKTALKPAQELWTLARKPLSEKTIAENILKWGTGGINIDGCRIKKATDDRTEYGVNGIERTNNNNVYGKQYGIIEFDGTQDRFPANVIFDEEAGKILDEQSGILKSGDGRVGTGKGTDNQQIFGKGKGGKITSSFGDSGGASRFFYCAKAARSERNKGLENMDFKKSIGHNRFDKCNTCGKYILQNPDRPSACQCDNPEREDNVVSGNFHPTVKPVSLMRYLVRMITPKGGKCLDPYAGSCTTGIALEIDGFDGVLIEREKEFCEIGKYRIKAWKPEVEKTQDGNIDAEAKKNEPDEDKEQLSLF